MCACVCVRARVCMCVCNGLSHTYKPCAVEPLHRPTRHQVSVYWRNVSSLTLMRPDTSCHSCSAATYNSPVLTLCMLSGLDTAIYLRVMSFVS